MGVAAIGFGPLVACETVVGPLAGVVVDPHFASSLLRIRGEL